MVNDASSEVVHCPNCKEDVPKTLYCLNCGYPLYKSEEGKSILNEDEADIKIIVDEEEKALQPEPLTSIEQPEQSKPIEENKPIETISKPSEKWPAPIETSVSNKELSPDQLEVKDNQTAIITEKEPTKVDEMQPSITKSEPVVAETINFNQVEVIERQPITFLPDSISKDTMINLARSITVNVRLVKLLREGQIKEESFYKLYERYNGEMKKWTGRRSELLNNLLNEIEEIESRLSTSTESLETLEVRRAIGEASEGEYDAWAPALKWDLGHLDLQIGEKRNTISFLENIGNVLSSDELEELRTQTSIQYNTLDALQISENGLLEKLKASLYEAIKILG